MKIMTGLFDHMVLQRARRGGSDAPITGEVQTNGPVLATVRTAHGLLRGCHARTIGRADNGKFTARLKGLPPGGPYRITLSVTDAKTAVTDRQIVRDVLVGDVWIIAGQSNAEGYGRLADRAKPQRMTRAFYMDDHWAVAEDPMHCLAESVDQVHVDLCGGVRPPRNKLTGVGPGVAFGQQMHRTTGLPQGLIASAHGGTSMLQWDPAKRADGSKSLYGATLRRIAKNGGKIAGIVWYQGESECNPTDAALYVPRMQTLVASFRQDLGQSNLPFVCVQLSRFITSDTAAGAAWQRVREEQRLLPEKIQHFATVPAIDLTLDDIIHISGRDQQVLGRRLAQAMLALLKHPRASLPPITLRRIRRRATEQELQIILEFGQVAGKLEAGGRPLGFYLRDRSGAPLLYDTRLDGSRAMVYCSQLSRAAKDPTSLQIGYGAGTDPSCNIHDSAGRSLPAFGPIRLVDESA